MIGGPASARGPLTDVHTLTVYRQSAAAIRQSVYFRTQSKEKFLVNRALLYWHYHVARTAVCVGSELKVVKFRTLKHLLIAAHRDKVIA